MMIPALVFLFFLRSSQAALNWGPCEDVENTSPFLLQCATLRVPRDYANKSSNTSIKLELARIQAAHQPSRGSIQVNFGGPGVPSRGLLPPVAATLMGVTGGQHDLVVFDSRTDGASGTGNTIPFVCHDDYNLLKSPITEILTNQSDIAPGYTWARGTLDAQACFRNEQDVGELIGTAYVARDMIDVVDALQEDGMLRYWGFSYGTTLGATVAAMFPERIDKVVLDGVQNPHEYYYATADFEEWTDADKVLREIFQACLELPEKCALSRSGKTAEELENKYWDLLYRIKFNPIATTYHILDYTTLKVIVASNLYSTAMWGDLAVALQGLFDGKINASLEKLLSIYFPTDIPTALSQGRANMALFGIHCSDRTPRVATLEDLLPTERKMANISRAMGDASSTNMACAQWLFNAKERYEGDFRVKTANPVLFIGNHFDSHTPLKSAYNVSSGFEGSRVLEVAGYGHTSLNVPSVCVVDKVSAYFNEGVLPDPGCVCKAFAPPYSSMGWPQVFEQIHNRTISPRFWQSLSVLPYGFIPGRKLP